MKYGTRLSVLCPPDSRYDAGGFLIQVILATYLRNRLRASVKSASQFVRIVILYHSSRFFISNQI